MIFSPEGFPRVENAHDFADSPVIASWMAILDYANQIDMGRYYDWSKRPVRYPFGHSTLETNPRCMSRDQLVMLCAGEAHQWGTCIYKPGLFAPNDMDEVTGRWKIPDCYSPSAQGHFRRCRGEKANWFQDVQLKADFWYNGKFTPLREQNQIQVMAIMADRLQEYVDANPSWFIATFLYWYDCREIDPWTGRAPYNRGEYQLAVDIVNFILKKVLIKKEIIKELDQLMKVFGKEKGMIKEVSTFIP